MLKLKYSHKSKSPHSLRAQRSHTYVNTNGGQKPGIYVTLSWGTTTTTTTIPRPARQEKYSILPEFGVLWNPLTAWAGPGDGGGGGGGGGIP